jgi:hypothetical protein
LNVGVKLQPSFSLEWRLYVRRGSSIVSAKSHPPEISSDHGK